MDPNDWTLTGNAGTDPATNFLGTTDNKPLVIRTGTNGQERLRVDEGGNVGIGTAGPLATRLEIASDAVSTDILRLRNTNAANPRSFRLGPGVGQVNVFAIYDDDASATRLAIDYSGNVSIPSGSLSIGRDSGISEHPASPNIETTEVLRLTRPAVSGVKNSNSMGLFLGAFEPGISGRSRLDINVSGTPGDANGFGGRPDVTVMTLQGDGSVGIGTTSPGGKLEVSSDSSDGIVGRSTSNYGVRGYGGDIGVYAENTTTQGANKTSVYLATNGLAGNFNGNVYITGNVTVTKDVILTGADCAEEFDIAKTVDIEPGTVVVLDQDGVLHQSHQAYDKRVAGVISGAGDYKPGLILDRQQSQDYRVPVALVGKVYCKVDAQYAPIEVGDLLTTSSTPGHAMKADDPFKAFGSVIGKALRSLESGLGMIPILIALQ